MAKVMYKIWFSPDVFILLSLSFLFWLPHQVFLLSHCDFDILLSAECQIFFASAVARWCPVLAFIARCGHKFAPCCFFVVGCGLKSLAWRPSLSVSQSCLPHHTGTADSLSQSNCALFEPFHCRSAKLLSARHPNLLSAENTSTKHICCKPFGTTNRVSVFAFFFPLTPA